MTAITNPYFSLIIPAYNERDRLPKTLVQIQIWLESKPWEWEVLIVDDGSTDGTPEMIEEDFPWCRVLKMIRNQGKGGAVCCGMIEAKGEYRLFSDADLSTPIETADIMMSFMEKNHAQVVIGSRALPGADLRVRQPWLREFSGKIFNRLVRLITGLEWMDTQCGFKLFRHDAAELVFPCVRSRGWAFDVEMLMIAKALKLVVYEMPVCWSNDEASKVSLMRAAPAMLMEILKFRWWLLSGQLSVPKEDPKSN